MPSLYIPPSQDARYIEDESEFYIVEQSTAKNYCRNGGFENGLDFWVPNTVAALAEGRYGGHALRVPSTMTAFTAFESATSGSTTGYVRMYISFDAKAVASGAGPITLTARTSGGATITSTSYSPSTASWTRYTLSFVPTTATSQAYFSNPSGSIDIDNVHISTEVVDLHIPMPQALAMRAFDYDDQFAPYVASEGLSLRLTPFEQYGFKMSGVVGLGYESPQNNTLALTTGEERFLSTVPVAKDFSITGTISDASTANVDRKKAALIARLSKDPSRPVILAHKRRACKADMGNLGFIRCVYTGGLGIQRVNNFSQDISLDFHQLDPAIYYSPKTLNVNSIGALMRPTDPTTTATFPRRRYTIRYKDQPYRAVRNTGYSTIYSQVNGAAQEDAEGNLWVMGVAAEELANENSLVSSATTRYLARLYKNSCIFSSTSVTHGTSADIYGAVPLQNGDMLFYGRFTSPGTGVMLWSMRGATYTAAGNITSTLATMTISKMRRVGNRIWWICDGNITLNGSSLGTDTQCRRSIFYTDDYFATATRYQLENSYTPLMDFEVDDAGNVYVLSIITPSTDDIAFVYKINTASDGTVSSDTVWTEVEDSSHVTASTLAGSLLKRKQGVGLSYSWTYALPGTTTLYYIAEIADKHNQSIQTDPGGFFYNLGRRGGDENRSNYSFHAADGTGYYADKSQAFFRNYGLSASVEYTDGDAALPSIARTIYRSESWELSSEWFVDPYRTLPVYTSVTNSASTRTYPHVRFTGGGYRTYLGRLYNETNGSSLAFSGSLRGGEEFVFDPLNPVLPDGVLLVQNTGPDGVFSLEPGSNSILCQVNTLWSPIASGAVSGSNCLRHLELTALVTNPYYTGKIILTESAGTLAVGTYTTGPSLSATISNGSTTALFTEPSGTLNVLSQAAVSASGVNGLALMYSGTYTAYSSGPLYVPLVQLISPVSALTIEAGTI